MNLLNIGSAEKTERSKFQIRLIDETDKSIHPMKRDAINRFFENESDRNRFVNALESTIQKVGGRIVHDVKGSHPVFASFDIFDKRNTQQYSLTVYL